MTSFTDPLVGARSHPSGKQPTELYNYHSQVAGVVSKSIEHPFDLVKVRLQSQPLDRPFKFAGPLDCFIQTVKGEGVKALWRVSVRFNLGDSNAD